MTKLLLVPTTIILCSLLTSCVTEPMAEEDSFYDHERPAPVLTEEESAISRQNRINANQYRMKHGRGGDYQPSPGQPGKPSWKMTFPYNEPIIIETESQSQ
ncbi:MULTISPECIES: hypothetical protein [unclassified Endozoicomonas]|uniref:hypothetical protein n=1 Tax=unclassified Endozoicomonas TaxID=2644528 RepID=UPI00214840EB|nr:MULTISPECIES: hypothetical protein [unclassified Endozoicomonas]